MISLNVRWCELCAATTLYNGAIEGLGRKPEVVVDIGCFPCGAKWPEPPFIILLLLYKTLWWSCDQFDEKKKENLIFVQSSPPIHCVLFHVFTKLGTVPKMVTPASWNRCRNRRESLVNNFISAICQRPTTRIDPKLLELPIKAGVYRALRCCHTKI